MKIRIDQADKVFSQYVRLRDRKCMRCGSRVQLNNLGLPITHQASHYFSRGKENTRFSSENVDTLCYFCHLKWGGDDRESYRRFKIAQLGQDGFDRLYVQSEILVKKDRKTALLVARELLRDLLNDK